MKPAIATNLQTQPYLMLVIRVLLAWSDRFESSQPCFHLLR